MSDKGAVYAFVSEKARAARFVAVCAPVRGSEFPAMFRTFVSRVAGRVTGRWQLVLALGVLAMGPLEFGLQLYFSRAAPALSEWQALRPRVEQLAGAGTLVVVAPSWAEPNARFAFGDQLMPLSQVARADESSFARALEVSTLGQDAHEVSGWHLDAEERVGRFALRSWTNPRPEPMLYDFLEHLQPGDVTVSVGRADAAEACPFKNARVTNGDLGGHPTFPKKRFVCPGGNEWQFVGSTVIEDEKYRPRRCMWAHPPNRGVLQLRFESVPIGSKIVGYGALPYLTEREKLGAPIALSVYVAGEQLGSWQHADGEGWKRFEFSTQRFAGQQQPVEFRVESAKPWQREFCFQADVR
jgi:hypothetical protein